MSKIVGLYLCKTCNGIYTCAPNMQGEESSEEPGYIPDEHFHKPNYDSDFSDMGTYIETVHGKRVYYFHKEYFLVCEECKKNFKIALCIMGLVGFKYLPTKGNQN